MRKSPTFLRHTASSGAKSKVISRTELADIQSSIHRLAQRSHDLADTSYTVDAMAPQVQALRKGFATLSDVLVEEIDTLRAELRAVKDAASQQQREISSLKLSNQSLERQLQESLTRMESVASENRELHMTVERLNAASITSDSKLSMLTSQYAAVSGELTDIRERTIGWSSLPSTVDANTAAITEIIQDNQLLHEAVLTLTATAKATAAELASQKDGNLSLYVDSKASCEALSADLLAIKKAVVAFEQRANYADDISAQLEDKLNETMLRLRPLEDDLPKDLEANFSELKSVISSHRAVTDNALARMQSQQDHLTVSLDECSRSLSTCKEALSTQRSATEASITVQSNALSKSIQDVQSFAQRHVDALTTAVQAIADVLRISPGIK